MSAAMNVKELETLYQKAKKHAGPMSPAPCKWFYRNASEEYFEEILFQNDGLMKVILKDNTGDQRSPINGQLFGLFFNASVSYKYADEGEPIPMSPYGPTRLLVPALDLLEKAPNLYFADFYCMPTSGYHYVTLVMTKGDSESDKFCAKYLHPVDIRDNPFLRYRDDSQKLQVTNKDQLIVEMFFTEDLDITDYELKHNIPLFGSGKTTPGGLPKVEGCPICNV